MRGWDVAEDMRDEILTPGEVAKMFGVDVKTVTRWVEDGKMDCFRTLGGHRRFYRSDVEKLREERSEYRNV